MKIGAIVPQGWVGDYDGWDASKAWKRTTEVAQQADRLGFESIWLFDHFHTVPRPTDEITFESFTSLAALAALTSRVRLGHIVICTAFRNPALTAKMISTMDTISGGRMDLGIGAGWKRDEWLAYGYGFPETKERLARLGDDLGVISAMLAGDKHEHATYDGRHSHVKDAINVPKPIQQPRVPIMVGGNGPNVTWRLAARHVAGRGPRGTPRRSKSMRGDRPRPLDARHLGPHLDRNREHRWAVTRRSARRVPRCRRGPRPGPGQGQRHERRSTRGAGGGCSGRGRRARRARGRGCWGEVAR
jgi:alkanesulfonate monooxygenase SsuD/methylene tetrahydromethanopterin reductase-like flavin-dependent oxidoreductase (luciferase family)